MIELLKNKEIKLKIPHFSCDDNAVGTHLNEHPLTQLLNVYGFLCVIGRPGSGKTSLTISLLTQSNPKIYKKTHHHIIIVMPANSIGSIKGDPFKGLENIYNEINDSIMNDIYSKIDGWSKNDEKTILYIDDMTADLKKTKIIIDTMKKLIYNRRHLKLNIIITAQSYVNIPLDVRKNTQNLIMFKPPKKELEIVFSELIESKKEHFDSIMRFTYDGSHNFLFVNVPAGRMFKNWDELIIKDVEELEDELEIKSHTNKAIN